MPKGQLKQLVFVWLTGDVFRDKMVRAENRITSIS